MSLAIKPSMQRSGLVQWALEEPFLELLLLFGFDFLDLCF